MSQEEIQQVISRLAAYEDFRSFLATNPKEALKSYKLTPKEKSALKDIANSRFYLDIDEKGHIELVS